MALRVRSDAQVRRAAPNSLRYAAFKQGARSQFLKSLRDARQTFRSSPMQKGNAKELGSLRVASMVAALRACAAQVDGLRVRSSLCIQGLTPSLNKKLSF